MLADRRYSCVRVCIGKSSIANRAYECIGWKRNLHLPCVRCVLVLCKILHRLPFSLSAQPDHVTFCLTLSQMVFFMFHSLCFDFLHLNVYLERERERGGEWQQTNVRPSHQMHLHSIYPNLKPRNSSGLLVQCKFKCLMKYFGIVMDTHVHRQTGHLSLVTSSYGFFNNSRSIEKERKPQLNVSKTEERAREKEIEWAHH